MILSCKSNNSLLRCERCFSSDSFSAKTAQPFLNPVQLISLKPFQKPNTQNRALTNPALNIPVTLYQSVVPRVFSGAEIMTHAYSEIHTPKALPTPHTEGTPLSTTNQNPAYAITDNQLFALNPNHHKPTLGNNYDNIYPYFFHLLTVPGVWAASWGKPQFLRITFLHYLCNDDRSKTCIVGKLLQTNGKTR